MSPTDVVLRFDNGLVDYGICELCGGWGPFTPGPEFTLYGDGTVILRDENAKPPPAEGPIVRASPFMTAHLDEDQVQSLLQFAIGEGGLRTARGRYDTTTDTDDPGYSTLTIRAGGLDKRIEIVGSHSPFQSLTDDLRNVASRDDVSARVWVPGPYWGLLIEAGSWIEAGVLRDLPATGAAPWPWPAIAPEDFVTPTLPGLGNARRAMSQEEAAVLGLSNNGGVVRQIYFRGPNNESIYSFSLWPMLPDETTP